nr:uncharacterized protein LOC109186867 isoform X2 [Ipomoea trifida]
MNVEVFLTFCNFFLVSETEKDCEIMMIKTNQLEVGELKYYGDTTKELNEIPAAHYLLDNHIEAGDSMQKRDYAKGVIEVGGLNKKAVSAHQLK